MKKMILSVGFLLCITTLSAQQKFGIATYSVPAGWQVSEQSSTVTIENETKNGICKITIFLTERPVGISAFADYTRYRSKMSMENVAYGIEKGSIIKNEVNGIVSFLSFGNGTINGVKFRNYFYSVSNGKESYFVQLSASDNTCVTTFNTFLNDLFIDQLEESNTGGTKTKKRKAKAAASMPPAPVAPLV